MARQNIKDYIKEMLQKGHSLEDIESKLLEAGWSDRQVDAAVDSIYETSPREPGMDSPKIKGNFPTLVKPKKAEDVYPGMPGQAPDSGRGMRTSVKIIIVALAICIGFLVVMVLFDSGILSPGTTTTSPVISGFVGFQVPPEGIEYVGSTGTLKIILKSTESLTIDTINVTVSGSTSTSSPGIVMNPGSQNSFIVGGLPQMFAGQQFNAQVNVHYSSTGLTHTSSGSIIYVAS